MEVVSNKTQGNNCFDNLPKEYPTYKYNIGDLVIVNKTKMKIHSYYGYTLRSGCWMPTYICCKVNKKGEINKRLLNGKRFNLLNNYKESDIDKY